MRVPRVELPALVMKRARIYGPADFGNGLLLTIPELTDDFLKLFVEDRVRILDELEQFVNYDIGFGRKWNGKRFAGFHALAFENLVVDFLRCRHGAGSFTSVFY